jgi:hypothetical protein
MKNNISYSLNCVPIPVGLRKTFNRLGTRALVVLIVSALASFCLATPRRIIVERPEQTPADSASAPFQYEPGRDGAPPRMVIDPSRMIYQMQVDSINKSTEDQIKKLIEKLERKFNDPVVEEEVGKLIGEVVMRQQMALLDLQIDRALEMKDSLLLEGLELALREMLANTPGLREEIQRQLDALEQRFEAQR